MIKKKHIIFVGVCKKTVFAVLADGGLESYGHFRNNYFFEAFPKLEEGGVRN